jgi:uncharacterized membrane protein YoaK (UPF0700 family)
MPIHYLRALTSRTRTDAANRRLGLALATVAGATNAGGFLAVGQYTSHMTGIVAGMTDNLALGDLGLVAFGLCSLSAFVIGAATSAILINWGRRRQAYSEYATPLMLEAVLLLCFGLLGANVQQRELLFTPITVGVLCFVMGLQNAMITKISKAEIRTTHVTGLVTDIGIELGKLVYWNRGKHTDKSPVRADRGRLQLFASLLGMFVIGGLLGAFGFKHFGFIATVPIAMVLIVLAGIPVLDDLMRYSSRLK